MGRGYVVGLLAGALFSSVSVAALSLIVSPAGKGVSEVAEAPAVKPPEPETPKAVAEAPATVAEPEAAAPVAEAASVAKPAPEAPAVPEASEPAPTETAPATVDPGVAAKPAVPEPAPEPAAPQPPAPQPAAAPSPTEQASLTPRPETPVVDVPAGSEFNRPKPEVEPVVPATQPAPAASAAPAVTPPAADTSPAMTEQSPAAVPQGQAEAPAAPPVSDTPDAVAEAPADDSPVPVPPPGEAVLPDLTPAEPDAAAPAPAGTAPAAPATGFAKPTSRLPQIIAPAPEPAPDATAEAASEPAPEPETVIVPPGGAIAGASNKPRILTPGTNRTTEDGPVIIDVAPSPPVGAAPQVGFGQRAPGVQVNRLPRIGDAAPAPDASAPDAAAADAAPETAVTRFRANFDNAEKKPVIAIVLVDDGTAAAADPEAIGQIGAPVTVALNPEATGVSVLAQTHRLAGDEVAILAPQLPAGATPSDLEVSYQAYVQTLPESVALVALPDSAVQSDSMVAKHMAALLGSEGRGLVTSERGLNPARQAAERAGVPYAGITRTLEEGGQDAAAIGRLLDRAAFDASRGASVVVMGRATPETVAAIRTWNEAGGHEAIVGPLSAVLAP